MAFSELTKVQAMRRAGGRCQCTRHGHGHTGRCPHKGVEFHHKLSQFAGGGDGLANCEVLCVKCHRLTTSYGRH